MLTFFDGSTHTILADGTTEETYQIPDPDENPLVLLTVNYGDLPGGWQQDNGGGRIELYGSFIDPGRSGGTAHDFLTEPVLPVVNTATLAGRVQDAFGNESDASDSDSATIDIESPQPHVAIFKSVSATGNVLGNGVFPSTATSTTTLTWTVRVRNDATGTAEYPDPVIVDVLPTLTQNALGQGGLAAPADFVATTPAGVTCPGIPGIGTVDGTVDGDLKLTWECAGDLTPGEEITITFTTDVEAGTPPQTVVNTGDTTTNSLSDTDAERFSVWDGGESNGTWLDDLNDLDGDGSTSDRIRASHAQIEVLDYVFLTSVKEVRGGVGAECNDGTFPRTARTTTCSAPSGARGPAASSTTG